MSLCEIAGRLSSHSASPCQQPYVIGRYNEVFATPWNGALALITGLFLVVLAVAMAALADPIVGQWARYHDLQVMDKALISVAKLVIALPLAGASWAAIGLIPSAAGQATAAVLGATCVVLLNLWARRHRVKTDHSEINCPLRVPE